MGTRPLFGESCENRDMLQCNITGVAPCQLVMTVSFSRDYSISDAQTAFVMGMVWLTHCFSW
jgi:hypothetical protein